jgi:integrase
MAREKLTELKVKSLNRPGRYGDGGGLWLQVRDASKPDRPPNKSWLFRYTMGNRQRQLGIGSYPLIGLKDARAASLVAARSVHAGRDPIGEKRARKAEAAKVAAEAMTFKGVAELYLAAHESTWRNPKHRWQWRQTLEAHVYPTFGGWPVAEVDTGAVMKVIEPLWHAMPETAGRLRGRIETILDYAKARGWRTGDNPARWRGHVASLLPPRAAVAKVEHHAALPYPDIGAFIARLALEEGTAATALAFTILTAARTTEAIGAQWSEVNLDAAVWTVPGARMKAGREHRVPLTPAALDALRAMLPSRAPSGAGFIFPGQRKGAGLSNMAMTALMRRMGHGRFTVHGFRSTFRDWAAERTTVAREVAEAALAHALKDKTEAAYQRSDLFEKRRRLMEAWATYCSKPEAPAGAVTPIRAVG